MNEFDPIASRIDVDQYYLEIAYLIASRGTCRRRRVGCVLTDEKNRILATGYNGVERKVNHCESECPGLGKKSGEDLNLCRAIHAEQNALTQCSNTDAIHSCYTTVSPCDSCIKLLLSTGCQVIIYPEEYREGKDLAHWTRKKILLERHKPEFVDISKFMIP